MSAPEVEQLKAAIQRRWASEPSAKARRYLGTFFNATRAGTKLAAQVEGHHGTYTLSLQMGRQGLVSACSCYRGKQGFCHHCEALGFTFLEKEAFFKPIAPLPLENNAMEQALKLIIRGRNNSLFFKTPAGAAIADVITSVVATAYYAGIHVFDYLIVLQRYAEHVKRHPQLWLPWNYASTLHALQEAA